MTLILAALSKNGICVCADKRNVRPNLAPQDNLNKIYPFERIPLIIYNHGVNKFNGKMWSEYCSEYKKLNKWIYYKFTGICENFRKFIEKYIYQELERNFQNGLPVGYTKSGFVFCGKTDQDPRFRIRELIWTYSNRGLELEKIPRGNIVLSGDGKEYLKSYLNENKEIFTNEYWEELNLVQAEDKLRDLFRIAVEEKNKVGGNEFSDNFDTVSKQIK